MIKKFQFIKSLGVFQNFQWDQEVVNTNGQVERFQHINVIYGRNYSGKTTLSRLLRSLETHSLSDKFEGREFKIVFDDGEVVDQRNYHAHAGKIRVFNEDFVHDNLRFINDPDESIVPFALIGDDNVAIQTQIDQIEMVIGSNEVGQETGLFADLKLKKAETAQAKVAFDRAASTLESQMRHKAIDRNEGIKYNSYKFGDQNYTISKLEQDIGLVLEEGFTALSDEGVAIHEALLKEDIKEDVGALQYPVLSWDDFSKRTEELVGKAVAQSEKIEELVSDAVLNRWVKEGRGHHKSKREDCAFCGNKIDESRWELLDKHFDEESERLEAAIDKLLEVIASEAAVLPEAFDIDDNLLYAKFKGRLAAIKDSHKEAIESYLLSLNGLTKQLQSRKDDLIHSKDFVSQTDHTNLIQNVLDNYETLRNEANEYSNRLESDQSSAMASLRLKTVHEFAATIGYSNQKSDIENLAKALEDASRLATGIEQSILQKQREIEAKRREMNDEEKGARKVNDYLNHFFGHNFITLEAQENPETELEAKSIRFEVTREGAKAYHLSEGECSLLAFCYFLAKLDDIETQGSKPIVWIDDPISSLDSNHIFFLYSLIYNEIVSSGRFVQLFISTHNLDFLKYLKRLATKSVDALGVETNYQKSYFLVTRSDRASSIKMMPKHLKDFVTEFNYLFDQIYRCATVESVDDSNYTIFYNFTNSARKFLEIYLYYKFPNSGDQMVKLQRFFGNDAIPTVLVDRINNEYSHLCGVFERGETPVEVPEMKTAAMLILDRLKQDQGQYDALLESIGAQPEVS
jgi:wobble nucleotide-excising tRNase